MGKRFMFTSESVTEGHPDKVADQISDAILDSILDKDPLARVACETMVTTGLAFVSGEITTDCYVDIASIVRRTIRRIGYTRAKYGFDCDTCAVLTAINEQSPDIALGVNKSLEAKEFKDIAAGFEIIGAGDQGMMFGYATNETPEYMPLPISLAHKMSQRLAAARRDGSLGYLRPDGKTQVTVEYEDNQPVRVATVVVSAQHNPKVDVRSIREDIIESVIKTTVPAHLLDKETRYFVNPTGRFVVGGPQGDCGLTGRKIIVDTYGGIARHGGGAFSGKDPTKVDRSASYAMRHIAKNIVAAGLAERCEIQVAYAIGVARPVSLMVNSFDTGNLPDDKLSQLVLDVFDLRPGAIIHNLGLRSPIYEQVAAYGHFGRPELDLPWERLDKVEAILETAKSL